MTGSQRPDETSPGTTLLAATGICKHFGDFTANDDVGFEIEAGEIHALLGENGAGKSTFVKMVYGLLQPDSGQIIWRGEPVTIRSPQHARELGIGMVFQHFSLFQALTVAENIALALRLSERPAFVPTGLRDLRVAVAPPESATSSGRLPTGSGPWSTTKADGVEAPG